jgi:hypothetical protein
MNQRRNTASRVYQIFTKAAELHGGLSSFDMWSNVFGRIHESEYRQRVFLSHMIGLLYDELDLLERQMANTSYSPPLYVDTIVSLRKALNTHNWGEQWISFQKHVDRTVLTSLQWMSESLPDDDTLVTDEEFNDLYVRLSGLQAEVVDSNLPPEAKNFLLIQIEILLQALREFRVRGSVVFAEALVKAATRYGIDIQVVKRQEADETFQKVWGQIRGSWAWVRERTDDVQAIALLYEGVRLIGSFLK